MIPREYVPRQPIRIPRNEPERSETRRRPGKGLRETALALGAAALLMNPAGYARPSLDEATSPSHPVNETTQINTSLDSQSAPANTTFSNTTCTIPLTDSANWNWSDSSECDTITIDAQMYDGQGLDHWLQRHGVPEEKIPATIRATQEANFTQEYLQKNDTLSVHANGQDNTIATWKTCPDGLTDLWQKDTVYKILIDTTTDNFRPVYERVSNTPATAQDCHTCLETIVQESSQQTPKRTAVKPESPPSSAAPVPATAQTPTQYVQTRDSPSVWTAPAPKSTWSHTRDLLRETTPIAKDAPIGSFSLRDETLWGFGGGFAGWYSDTDRDFLRGILLYVNDKKAHTGVNKKGQNMFTQSRLEAQASLGVGLSDRNDTNCCIAPGREFLATLGAGYMQERVTDKGAPGHWLAGWHWGAQGNLAHVTRTTDYGWGYASAFRENYTNMTLKGIVGPSFVHGTKAGLLDDYTAIRPFIGAEAQIDHWAATGFRSEHEANLGAVAGIQLEKMNYGEGTAYTRTVVTPSVVKGLTKNGPWADDWGVALPVTYDTIDQDGKGWRFKVGVNWTAFRNGEEQLGLFADVLRLNSSVSTCSDFNRRQDAAFSHLRSGYATKNNICK